LFPYAGVKEVKKYKTQPLRGCFTVEYDLQLMFSGADIKVSAGVGDINQPTDLAAESEGC